MAQKQGDHFSYYYLAYYYLPRALNVRPTTTNTNIGFALPKVLRPPAAIIAQVSKPWAILNPLSC